MDYIDLEGNIVENKTSQDKFLEFMYTNWAGKFFLKFLVRPGISNFAGKLLSTKPSALLVRSFIRHNDIDMTDFPVRRYGSFNDFFTRKITPGTRPFEASPLNLVSPCDCKASAYRIHADTTFSIKYTEYTLRTLLRSAKLAKRFQGGTLFLLRLTVDDYHRYIYAVSGRQSKNYHIPGCYHTVNPVANDYLPIYKENTREYTLIHSPSLGDVIQMEVGALMVGRIKNHKQSCSVSQGEEKGYFEYGGSTIIVLAEKNRVIPRADLLENTRAGYETKLLQGQLLGTGL